MIIAGGLGLLKSMVQDVLRFWQLAKKAVKLVLKKKNDYTFIKGSSRLSSDVERKSSLQEAKTVILEIQMNSTGSQYELLFS